MEELPRRNFGWTSILLFWKDWNSIRFWLYSESSWRSLIRKSMHVTSTSAKKPHWNTNGTEIGSDHAQREEAGKQSWSFQRNQSTLNPIRERSERPDITQDVIGVQDGRRASRSQEIDVNSFCEELSSSERRGQLVTGPVSGKPVHETSVIQTRSSEDRKDFNVKQAHEPTGRLSITHDVINVSDSSQIRSAHESETFNVGDETLRERNERSVADHDVSHESMMVNEADMDFRIPGVPHSVVKHAQSSSVRELIQKIENHLDRHALQQDLRQNQTSNPLSPESKKMIQDVV